MVWYSFDPSGPAFLAILSMISVNSGNVIVPSPTMLFFSFRIRNCLPTGFPGELKFISARHTASNFVSSLGKSLLIFLICEYVYYEKQKETLYDKRDVVFLTTKENKITNKMSNHTETKKVTSNGVDYVEAYDLDGKRYEERYTVPFNEILSTDLFVVCEQSTKTCESHLCGDTERVKVIQASGDTQVEFPNKKTMLAAMPPMQRMEVEAKAFKILVEHLRNFDTEEIDFCLRTVADVVDNDCDYVDFSYEITKQDEKEKKKQRIIWPPRSAFSYFCDEKREEMMKTCEDRDEMRTKLREVWKHLSPEAQHPFLEKQMESKKRHEQKCSDAL